MLYLIYHYGYFCPSISKQKTGETMKLKNRMVISFFVIILVPLILTGVAVAGFTMYQVWSLEKKYGIEGVTYENLSNNTMLLSKMTQKTFSTLEKTASSDPEKLEETSYLNSLNQDLTGKNAYLLIRKGNDMFTVVPRHRMNCSFPNFRNTAILLPTMTVGSISVPMCSPLSSRWVLPLLTVSKEVRLLFSIPIPWFLS